MGGSDGGGRVAPRLARLVAGPAGGGATRDSPGPDPLAGSAQLGLFEEVLDTLEHAAVPAGLLVVMTSTDPEAGMRELEHALAIGREIGDAEEVV